MFSDWWLDAWIIIAGVLCCVSASLLGNFLVLRKMSMLGDAISHAVLPGLAVAFFLSESRSSLPMFIGAVIAGLLTAMLTEWISGFGQVDESASMGVVFTALFAVGLIMIVQAADRVDLDPSCVLYGAIELTPLDQVSVGPVTAPRVVWVLGSVLLVNLAFVLFCYKELKLTSFDPALATSLGINAKWIHYPLMTLVAVTSVASFESVGNILVVAMFVVPPAAAYLLTDRLPVMIGLSALLAAASAVLGHISAITLPRWFGYQSTTTAGMMAVAAGALFLIALLFSPRHGVVTKAVRRGLLSMGILVDDLVALLYRLQESDERPAPADRRELQHLLMAGFFPLKLAIALLRWRGEIVWDGGGYVLTDAGLQRAQELVRSHRLWEQYLATAVGVAPERIHNKAESLEHFTDETLRQRLDVETESPETDPHGRPIPPESRT